MADVKVLKRDEIAEEFKWKLEDIFPTDEAWEEALKNAERLIEKGASFRGRLSESAKSLLDFMRYDDEAGLELSALFGYASRRGDEDTANPKYQDFVSRMRNYFVRYSSAMAYVGPEIISIGDETMEKFYKEEPDLELYRLSLDRIRREREHTLGESEELLLAAASPLRSAASNTYSLFEGADIKFPAAKDSEGREHELTNGTYIPCVQSADRVLRKNAFESLYHTYEQFRNTLASLYDSEVKGRIFNARARKYPSILEASLSRNEVPVSVYKNLIDTVHRNMGYMHKYVKLRKKIMGLDEMHMYDLYTSLVPSADKKVSFEEAKKTALEALQVLGDDYVAMLKEGFENRWIDVYENVGKRSGAYSAGMRPHPYVLLNHKDTLDSEFTLVHEMGHALHSYLSMKNQPTVYSDYVIFVAEVASTCNEALLMQHLLSKTTDKAERAYLINYFLEQFRTTLYRQTMFAEFEMLTGEMAERGESLTAESLSALYGKLNAEYYGDGVVNDPEIFFEWERIPHFYYNYYVFQYATGFSAAIALSTRILKEGEPAVKDYLRFLSGGCSTDPISLLKIAGVDMNSPEPIENALKLFGELIDELDGLMG